jgi:carbonic anhydrase
MEKIRTTMVGIVLLLAVPTVFGSEVATGVTPDTALKILIDGNVRYAGATSQHPRQDQERRTVNAAHGQHPFVSVLSCSDSRVPVEVLFDAGIGDIFVVRVAGNVAATDEIGSLEYGVGHLGTPLLLVLGHTKCGAVTAVVKNDKVGGSIPLLVANIKPAVVKTLKEHPLLTGDSLVFAAIRANVWESIEDVFAKSPEICEKTKNGEVKVVGGLYDIESGKVTIIGTHPQQEMLLKSAEEKPESHVRAKAATKPQVKAEPKSESKFINNASEKSESKFHH